MPTVPLWMALGAALPPHWSPIKVYFGITIILSIVGWGVLLQQAQNFIYKELDEFVNKGVRLNEKRGRLFE
ncbi:unnamed protein product, partial [marine sediment metagenome]